MKLNPAQQKVINHTNGPLLVVAGAGTGKTRVIVEKINALLDSGVPQQALLAVTFTEKAASEMLDRVLETHTGLLLDMPILTFNGYGQSILKEFGIDIGISASFTLLGEQSQIVFFRERIEEFKLDYFLPLSSSPENIIAQILKLISKLKQNLITPEAYAHFASTLLSGDEAEHLEKKKHQELAHTYATYVNLCRRDNVIDYDDQIYLTIQLLEQRPNVQKKLQSRYHTVFIDEFQDTNPMQSRLIDLLTTQDSRLIVVGDDDQSIYGFRGATIDNILGFTERYPNAKQVVLTENYRSHQAILDASYALIQHNNPYRLEAQLHLDKHLQAKSRGDKPLLKRFATTDQELAWLAKDIARRCQQVKSSDNLSIAVLTRSNPTAHAVHQALEQEGIEHQVVGANPDLYAQPAIRMLLELLRTLVEPENNASLHHTLVSELFSIPNNEIAQLASKAHHEHELLGDILSDHDNPDIARAMTLLHSLRTDAATSSVGRLLWRAVVETGYKDAIFTRALEDDTVATTTGYLNQFFSSLKAFESIAIQPTANQYLLSLPALMAAGETVDNTLEIQSNIVTVTTIHKAKGLEWDTVYIPFLTEGSFPLRAQTQGLTPPEELLQQHSSPADEHYAEERRIMYVALTRARENLTLSYSDASPTGSAKKPSRFIAEALGDDIINRTQPTEVDTTELQLVADRELPHPVTIPGYIYDGKTVRLSVSQAQALLTCPLNFYYKFVLRAPEEPTTSTDYGSQLHDLFEQINRGRIDDTLRPLDELLEELARGWNKTGYSSKTQQERAFARAKMTLRNFYSQAINSSAPKLVEHPFEVTLPGDLVLHGRMDAVFDDGKIVEIRDYKTGDSVTDQAKARRKATESQQLTMYALAWERTHGVIPKVSLQYPDTGQLAVISKQQKSLDTIEQKLHNVVDDLRAGKFPPASGRHEYCIHPEIT